MYNKLERLCAVATAAGIIFSATMSFADDCSSYPLSDGISIESATAPIKLLSTISIPISLDDQLAVKTARDEAVLEGKAAIANFLAETVKNDEAIVRTVEHSTEMNKNARQTDLKETVSTLKKMSQHSEALLRGVVKVGECYTKGAEVRVTVGVKADTIDTAADLSSGMQAGSLQTAGAKASTSDGPENEMRSYSDTKSLLKF